MPSPDDGATIEGGEPRTHREDQGYDGVLRELAGAPAPPAREPVREGARWGAGGRYVIDRRLGRGGMGTVYAANDTLLGRVVALKVLELGRTDDEEVHRARLLREARFAARVEHDRIARVYDVGEHEGSLFVSMELVPGVTLRSWMAGHEAGAPELCAVVTQIAEGLRELHARGILHGDLKPENVMLAPERGVRLVDFGLARGAGRDRPLGPGPAVALPLTASASLTGFWGTPGYMPPEQCAGERIDTRADVFALGVILYELVTGARPFVGEDLLETLQATREGALVFSGEVWGRAPPGLQAIAARMLARDPEDRLADGAAALLALREVAVTPSMPTVLLPAATSQELGEASTRAMVRARPTWRAGVAAGGAVAVASTIGLVLFLELRPRPAPRAPPLPGMAWIEGGELTVGRSAEDIDRECAAIGSGCDRELMMREVPSARVTIPPFQLDRYEVTNQDMAATLNALGGSLHVVDDEDDHYPRYVRWNKELGPEGEFLINLPRTASGPGAPREARGIEYTKDRVFVATAGSERLPVVHVTWHGARLFCASRGKALPTEDEWEAAARGRGDRPFPWGSAPVRCGEVVVPRDGLIAMPASCPAEVALAPVGASSQDVTPEGIHDLGGNVSEWVDATYVEGNREARPDRGTPELPKVLRGGSFAESLMARTSGRNRHLANGAGDNLGFRCAVR